MSTVFDDESAARLRRTIMQLARSMNRSAFDADLTPTQASVLGVIVYAGPVPLSRVAEVEGLSASMLSRVVGKLDELGLVTRATDDDDQRAVIASPTEAGRERSEKLREARTTELLAVIAELPEGEDRALLAALPALESFAQAVRAHVVR
jgi:DNA-binding MarR family transcriptional regulator